MKFDIVTPEKILISEQADMVVVPGVEGDLGIMQDHAPLISAVRPGVVAIYQGDKIIQSVFVSGGFAEVGKQGLSVLADDAMRIDEINLGEVTEKLKDAKEKLDRLAGAADSPEHQQDRQQTEKQLRILSAMVEAVNS